MDVELNQIMHLEAMPFAASPRRPFAVSLRRCVCGEVKLRMFVLTGLSIAATACSVGPNYHRPSAPAAITYTQNQRWKVATPNDPINRAAWWSIFPDPILDSL